MISANRFTAGFILLLLSGCAYLSNPSIVHQPTTARPVVVTVSPPANGAIYQAGYNYQPLFEDRRARNVGDTLIINIVEKTAASKKSDTSSDKTGSTSVTVPTIFGLPGKSFQGTSLSSTSDNKFEGKGASSSANDFTSALAVTVIEVLANGNLVVSGEKQIAMNQGIEFIRFSGVVNPNTIVNGNSVSSTQVADARIEYKADGYIDESQRMGWLQRFFLSFVPL